MDIPQAPSNWPYHVWFRLVRRRLDVACEVRASVPTRRAWLTVHPQEGNEYRLRYFEVEAAKYDEVVDSWDYDELLLDQRQLVVTGEDALRSTLLEWIEDLAVLSDPAVTSIPI